MSIERIKVCGFRSLLDFEVELSEGINVLVGPNGSGKTNFIKFLDFLANVSRENLNVALRLAGGATQVFSKEELQKKRPTLRMNLSGKFAGTDIYFRNLKEGSRRDQADLHADPDSYEYSLEITYDKQTPRIYISKEKILFSQKDGKPNVSFERTSPSKNIEEVSFKAVPKRNAYVRALTTQTNYNRDQGEDEELDPNEHFKSQCGLEYSFLWALNSETMVFGYIADSLSSLVSVNIDPSLARQSSPVGVSHSMSSRGEGLPATLHSLKNRRFFPSYHSRRRWRRQHLRAAHEIYSHILSWVTEVNVNIVELDVRLEPAEAIQIASVKMKFNDTDQQFDFSKLSDGTVKWIALVTTLFTDETFSVIEEPENFLHPDMQEVFVGFCEAVSANRRVFKSVLLSTHSETLLNKCAPEQLIYFKYDANGTKAIRPRNLPELQKLVQETKFGLGYYYRIGGVDV